MTGKNFLTAQLYHCFRKIKNLDMREMEMVRLHRNMLNFTRTLLASIKQVEDF